MKVPRITAGGFDIYPQDWGSGKWTLEIDFDDCGLNNNISIDLSQLKEFVTYIEGKEEADIKKIYNVVSKNYRKSLDLLGEVKKPYIEKLFDKLRAENKIKPIDKKVFDNTARAIDKAMERLKEGAK